MFDFTHMFSVVATLLGLLVGTIFAVILAAAGQGWVSLLAVPITPLVMVAAVKLTFGSDA